MEKRAWIEVNLNTIRDNIRRVKAFTGRKFMACVKADCYGMGAIPIAQKVEEVADFFGVATVPEGIELRQAGITRPILVMGMILPGDVREALASRLTLTVANKPVLKALASATRRTNRLARIHLKVDTGLGRVGIKPEETPHFLEEIAGIKGLFLEGIFTHLATAEWKDRTYARLQMRRFQNLLRQIEPKIQIPLKHIANSGAILNLPETYREYDLVRIGLLLLGVYPAKYLYRILPLRFALHGSCRILFVKEVPAGTPLSYNISFTTRRKTRVATLGLGYADGLRRSLSNKFSLEWKGRKVRILGNICMDQTLVDVTGLEARVGDNITFLRDGFWVEDMAETIGTAPQEILCGFGSRRVQKLYHGNSAP